MLWGSLTTGHGNVTDFLAGAKVRAFGALLAKGRLDQREAGILGTFSRKAHIPSSWLFFVAVVSMPSVFVEHANPNWFPCTRATPATFFCRDVSPARSRGSGQDLERELQTAYRKNTELQARRIWLAKCNPSHGSSFLVWIHGPFLPPQKIYRKYKLDIPNSTRCSF